VHPPSLGPNGGDRLSRPARTATITTRAIDLSFARYFWMHRMHDRRGAHPLRSSARALSETRQGRRRKTNVFLPNLTRLRSLAV
jgi:hypothetical protein